MDFNSYGRYLESTGSILKVTQSDNEPFQQVNESHDAMVKVDRNSIRFFSPKEIANLHCFPDEFGNYNYTNVLCSTFSH